MDAPSEHIPLEDGTCDVVCAFNSLDHVENIHQTISEIKRVTRPGGLFLLLVEVNHLPTDCEPHRLVPRKLIRAFEPEFHCEELQVYEHASKHIYESILAGKKYPRPENVRKVGHMSAKFRRRDEVSSAQ
jgi:ubiquinone/menaquinone biosynthesis C-methylase UbiE